MFSGLVKKLLSRTENDEALQRHRRQFLPAALEVEETPAHPAGRAILKAIVLLFVIALIWACVGKIDIVVSAQGKIIPGDRVKTIQPITIGEVQAIHIKEGGDVKAGDRLITLNDTLTQAELTRLNQDISAFALQLARQRAFILFLDAPAQSQLNIKKTFESQVANSTVKPMDDNALAFELQLLKQQVVDYQSARETLLSQLKSKEAEQLTTEVIVKKLQRILPIINERTVALEGLYKKKYGSREQYLELEQQRIEREEDIKAQQAAVKQLQAEQEEIQSQLLSFHAQSRRESLDEQEQLYHQLASLQQEWVKAKELHEQQVLRSPINGTVQQLQVHTIGGVVQPAQTLMQIVPQESNMEVEAWVLNKDIGFIEEGQKAEVKIDTFNFTKYGLIDGQVNNISSDAVPDEKLGLRYLTNVQIEKDWMQVENRKVNLSPGMSVTVEIKTGQRRLIEYFLSPLLRFKQESVRER